MRIGPRFSKGVVASFITMSPIGDEIDWEFINMAKTPKLATNNWFRRGDPYYGKDKNCQIPEDAQFAFHSYSIEWKPDSIVWYVDGRWCNQINRVDWPQGNGDWLFPMEKPNVQFGIWDGGFPEGTRDWTGGLIPWESPESDQGYEHTVAWVRTECWE
jgi:beta-glucanase (GH16 family)